MLQTTAPGSFSAKFKNPLPIEQPSKGFETIEERLFRYPVCFCFRAQSTSIYSKLGELPRTEFWAHEACAIRHIVARAGRLARIEDRVHPHQLRHSCGYYLATNGHDTRAIQDYLGHRNIQRRTEFVLCFQHGQIKDLCSLHPAKSF